MSTPESTAPAVDAETVRAQAHGDALAIAELCTLAGRPDLTASFLGEGLGLSDVRRKLLGLRAESPEITSHLSPTAAATASAPSLEDNPLIRAVKARAAQAKKER